MNKIFLDANEGAPETILFAGDATRITIPDAETLFQGDFDRQGSDLVIAGPSGSIIRVVNYFSSEDAPDLMSPEGAMLTGDIATRLAGVQNPLAYAQSGPASGQEPIGQIETLEGAAFATRANGQRVQLNVGDPVFEDDLVETGAGSSLGITFIDETVFSLSADARMVLDELVYEPGGSSNSMVMNLVQGTFVFVTGQVAPTGDMKVETPVATMGIRGTTPWVVIEGQNGQTQFGILKDPGGPVGRYEIFNKVTGERIDQIISENSVLSMDSVTSTPTPVTIDAATLAERAEAQSSAYFTYAASRARINRQNQDQNQDGDGDTPGDQSQNGDADLITGSIPGEGEGQSSAGLNGFDIDVDTGTETPDEGGGEEGSTESGTGPDGSRGGRDGNADTNLNPETSNATFQFNEDVIAVQGGFQASDDGDFGDLTFTITRQPALGAVISNGDGTFTYIPDPLFQTLQQGEVTAVSFDFIATDAVGATSNTSTVTLNVVGVNDVPVVTVVNVTGAVSDVDEDAGTPPSSNAGPQSASGSITFFDVDILDRPTATESTNSVTG